MTLLTLFLIYLAGRLIAAHVSRAAQERAMEEAQREAEQRAAERQLIAEQKQAEADRKARQRQLEADRKAQLKAEQMRLKAERAERKAGHTRLMAEQNIDSLMIQRENTQALYSQIESLLDGNISEKQKISYTRQLMALDDKLYRLDNKIANLMYQAETV